jgi:hypothetical protein
LQRNEIKKLFYDEVCGLHVAPVGESLIAQRSSGTSTTSTGSSPTCTRRRRFYMGMLRVLLFFSFETR